jgi:hypothetical protein
VKWTVKKKERRKGTEKEGINKQKAAWLPEALWQNSVLSRHKESLYELSVIFNLECHPPADTVTAAEQFTVCWVMTAASGDCSTRASCAEQRTARGFYESLV